MSGIRLFGDLVFHKQKQANVSSTVIKTIKTVILKDRTYARYPQAAVHSYPHPMPNDFGLTLRHPSKTKRPEASPHGYQ
jgi:hypothetical protein